MLEKPATWLAKTKNAKASLLVLDLEMSLALGITLAKVMVQKRRPMKQSAKKLRVSGLRSLDFLAQSGSLTPRLFVLTLSL